MGQPKALLRVHGETFLDRLIGIFVSRCEGVTVVLGHGAVDIESALSRRMEAQFVINPEPERGQLSSLQTGLDQIPACDSVIFTPVDYPGIQPSTVDRLLESFNSTCAFVIPRHDGHRGHPILFSPAIVKKFLSLPVTAQARDVVRAHRDNTRYVDVSDPGIAADIDDPQDYAELLRPAGVRA